MTASGAALILNLDLLAQSTADFTFGGTQYSAQQSISSQSFASAQALAGNANTPEARTAARTGLQEIAANARLDGKHFFQPTDIQTNFSTASYVATVLNLGPTEHLLLNFVLPASYVETTTNAEIPFSEVEAAEFAWIEVRSCSAVGTCFGPATRVFDFQGYLIDSYRTDSHLGQANAEPGLDVSALLNPTFTDTGAGQFLRTRNLSFPFFQGTADLGVFNNGEILEVSYTMQARAIGAASANIAISSINDPFFFDSDPVQGTGPISFLTAPAASAVPEPGSAWLLAMGVAGIAAVSSRRRSKKRSELGLRQSH